MGEEINTVNAPANRAGNSYHGGASSSADSPAQSEFAKAFSQEAQTLACNDPTAPTPREEALQKSLPENERHLPPPPAHAPPRLVKQSAIAENSGNTQSSNNTQNSKDKTDSQQHANFRDATGNEEESVLSEVIKGDFHEGKTTWKGTLSNVGVGLIPIVGQVADARDTAAAIKNVWNDPGSGGNWGMLGLAVVGWVPGIGDAIKGGGKIGKTVLKATATELVEHAGQKATKEAAEKATKEAAEKAAKEAAEKAKTAPEDLGEALDRQFGKLERGELAQGQGAMLGDLMFHGQRKEALAQLRQQIGQLPTRPGKTPPGTAVNPRPGYQSAHTTPQSALRNLPQYNPNEMITRFLPTGRGHAHTLFDQAWQREFAAISRQTGRTTTTVAELEEVVGRAARTSGAFSAAEAESVAQLIKNDLSFQLGLSPQTVLRMPGH